MAAVTRPQPRRKPAAIARGERAARQRRLRRTLTAQIGPVVQQVVEQALQEEVTDLLGRGKYQRRRLVRRGDTRARCARCGLGAARRLGRGGSYRRTLATTAATVVVRVPRVSCLCGGSVPLAFASLERYQRSWGDVQARARQLAGLCLSLRDVGEVLALDTGTVWAKSTLCGWVRQAGALARALRRGPIARVPAVVLLDGVWVKVLVETGETFADRAGHRRARVRRARVPLLVAYGIDPATGERWVLDWEQAPGEDTASWQGLLERLLERGLHATTGLTLLVHDGGSGLEAALDLVSFGPDVLRQRCIFHVLRNVRDAVRGEAGMDREQRRARRQAVLDAASAIWQASDRTEVQRRQRAFVHAWRAREPTAVALLERVFPATLGYLAALDRAREHGAAWQARHLRTTSPLERANRGLRQKARQVGVFGRPSGLEAGLGLVLAHRHPTPADAHAWADALERALLGD